MSLIIAVQMDPIGSINPKTDSTLAMMVEAVKRGHRLLYYTPDKLSYSDGVVFATMQPLEVFDDVSHYYELGEAQLVDLSKVDVVLLRQDPPYDMTYLSTTYLLSMLPPHVLVVNDPTAVRNLPEKIFPTLFAQFMPPTLISADKDQIRRFHELHGDIVIKPLYGYGGRAVLRIQPDDVNFEALLEMQFSTSKEPIMAQAFLPEVTTGDRRILLIDGEVEGIFGRTPQHGDIRANMRVGGVPEKAVLTEKQRIICDALRQPLKDQGLLFVGLDVIGDYLTEINITSPTGLRAYTALHGEKLERKLWDVIEQKAAALRQ
jgi:glutathione synthase